MTTFGIVFGDEPCSILFQLKTSKEILSSFLTQQPITNHDMGHFKYSYIDKTGKVVIDVGKYDGAGDFSGGLATVYLKDKGCGFIDKTGKEIIEPAAGAPEAW